ncbi:ABC transporter substrate-binding protein [Cohnella zeiphila]|uniref:ABC transporter substrate-binding protein n=1 Tax=Cohnella zeiphila TaxID=2761120 RepID=A0A7X0SRS4_9BACL|nr:ABC transporter substrate-binding protein [Cohnella zeiphila]MBB6733904.1 ABC transporter substrate-binding protein [Cohnella zeiphila]
MRNIQKWKKTLAIGAVMAMTVASLAACSSQSKPNAPSSGSAPASSAAAAAGGQTVSYRLGDIVNPEQTNNFNPFLKTGNYAPLFDYIYNSLYYFNPVKGELIPRLAADAGTWSGDGKSFTVKLNSQAKWQDGEAFTANDVVYTFQALKEHAALDYYRLWGDNRLKDVKAAGDDTVTFELSAPFPSLPNYLSTVYIVPEHLFSKENPETFLNKNPIGTGAFVFQSINESAIILKANADYFGGAPKIGELVIQRFKDSPGLTLALQKGEIQGSTGTLAMPSLPKLLENKDNKLQQYPGLSTYAVIINNDKPGLKDPIVRKAIQLAIDKKELVEKGEMGAATIGNPGFLSQGFGDLVDQTLLDNPDYQTNIDKANELLTGAGYKKNGKGVYEKDGVELSFVYYTAANAPAQNKEAAMITDWLSKVGIGTTIKMATWPELTSIAVAGNYDLIQNGITVPPDPQAALEVFHSKMTAPIGQNTPGLNWMRFRDDQIDAWLDQASTASAADRAGLYKQIQDRIAELAPVAVLYTSGKAPYSETKFTGYDTTVPATSALSLSQVTPK